MDKEGESFKCKTSFLSVNGINLRTDSSSIQKTATPTSVSFYLMARKPNARSSEPHDIDRVTPSVYRPK